MFHLLLSIIYLSFISLGLPDGLLGAAWPSMYQPMGVPISYAGTVSLIISAGTIVSSLLSDRLTRSFGTAVITACSVALTATALLGFSASRSFFTLCLWAIPYGLGAGSVDASLNNYVALHYSSRHMNWLHCMWGIGASLGPYIMGFCLSGGYSWNDGYLWIGLLQLILTAILLASLPLWKKASCTDRAEKTKPLRFSAILHLPGAKEVMVAFFCYCALEQTAGLWAASYLTLHVGLSEETAASLASLFFFGITGGRAVSGFLAEKINDIQMIRIGLGIIAVGVAALLLPLGAFGASVGFLLTGLGCAPIYPCIIHSTPRHFGTEISQAMIGIQMASAYIGIALMPPLFGILANRVSISLLGVFLLVLLSVMIYAHERLLKSVKESRF